MAQSELRKLEYGRQPDARKKPDHLWKPGQSGNPNGKLPGTIQGRLRELRDRAKAMGADPLDSMLWVTAELIKDIAKIQPRTENPDGSPITTKAELRAAQKEADHERRAVFMMVNQVASSLAPYMHPRLQRTELAGDQDQPVRVEHATDARARLADQLLRMAKVINGEAHEVSSSSPATPVIEPAEPSPEPATAQVQPEAPPPAKPASRAGHDRNPVVLPSLARVQPYRPAEARPARSQRPRKAK